MQRALLLGVAAAVMLVVAPAPSGAAGVTRTAPFDYGVQCFEHAATVRVPLFGPGTTYGCADVPDAQAQAGRLSTRSDAVYGSAAVVNQGLTPASAFAEAAVGPVSAATGVFTRSGVGGTLTASALVDGFTEGTFLCLYLGTRSSPRQQQRCGTRAPSASITAAPNVDYQIEVRLYTPQPTSTGLSWPCPATTATCKGGFTWTASEQTGVTVRSITYSWG